MALARTRSMVQRALALAAAASLAAMPLATIAVMATPAVAAAAAPNYPTNQGTFNGDLAEVANAGIVDLTATPASGPANPDPTSVTAVAGGSALQSASILRSDLSGSQLAGERLVDLHLESLPIQLPLSSMPLARTTAPKTWADVLAPTTLAGIPLVNVTWSQVVALGSSLPTSARALTLSDVDWSGSPLANLPLAAFTFGGAAVTSVLLPLQKDEPTSDNTAAERWCYLLNHTPGGSCAGTSLTGQTLIGLGVQGAPLKNIPLKNIPLKNIDWASASLAAAPLKNIPLKNIALLVAPLKNIPLKNIDMANAPLKNIPLKNILLDSAGHPTASPLKNIPLKNIAWATSPLKNIPLKNIDLASSPLKNIPLKNIDFATAPLKNIPLKNIDLVASSLGAIPLKNIAWATAPLKNIPLKNINLASSPLKNIPLKNIAASAAPLKNIPLKNIAWATAPLKNIPLKNINLGLSGIGATPLAALDWTAAGLASAPLSQFTVASGPLAAITVASLRNAGNVVACAADSSCPAGATLGSLAASLLPGATLGDIGATGFGSLALSDLLGARIVGSTVDPTLGDLRIDLAGVGAPALTIGSLVLNLIDAGSGVPNPLVGDLDVPSMAVSPLLGDLGLDVVAGAPAMTVSDLLAELVAGSPDVLLGDLGLNAMDPTLAPSLSIVDFLATLSSGQPDVTIGDLRLDTASGVDALVLDAITGFLLDPVDLAGYLLGALGTWTDITGHDITLGELGTWTLASGTDITLGDLAQYLDDSVSLADVLLGLVPASQFPFENFPISSLGLDAPGRKIIQPVSGFNGTGGGALAATYTTNQLSHFTPRFGNLTPFPGTPADIVFIMPAGATFMSVSPTVGSPFTGVTTAVDANGRTRATVPNIVIPPDSLFSMYLNWTDPIRLTATSIDVEIRDHVTGALVSSSTIAGISTTDGAEPNTPQEAIAANFGGGPASARVPSLPVNPNGCSSLDSSCTGRDSAYVDTLASGFISHAGDVDWYRIPNVRAGSRITADLTDLPVDADLVLYGPAGIGGSASAFPSSAQGLPGSLVEDPGLGVGQAARSLAVNGLNDLWLDPGYTDPFLQQVSPTNATIAPLTPLSIAQHSGTDPEGVGVIAPVSGDYMVQVSGYNTGTSADPYLLRVRTFSPTAEATCPARTFPNGTPTSTATVPTIGAGVNALILTNASRLVATYGATEAAKVDAALTTPTTGLLDVLGAHPALGVTPAIVPVDAYPAVQSAYAAWDANPCSVSAANAVATQITKVIADIRAAHPGISSITIAGGDDIIPMGRTPDLTRVSNESDYASTFANSRNPLSAAESAGFTLTDDNYADPSPTPVGDGSKLFVPKLAVGRLVEAPADIAGQINRYSATGSTATPGTLDTSTGLVTGYDFLADGATAVANRLNVGGRSVDSSLIDAPGSTSGWTVAQLLGKLFPSGGATPLVDSINAHYDHTALLSSAGNSGSSSDIETAADIASRAGASSLIGRLLFTMGCHAGLAVPDAYISPSDPAAAKLQGDWAQTLSTAGVAVYVANTGFGIGDTSTVAYSERLMGLYAKLLDGSMTAGQALAYAKQAYYGSLGTVGVYDLKILQQAEFYGLPFWRVSTAPGQAAPAAPSQPALPGTISTDSTTGLAAMALTEAPSLTQVPLNAATTTPRFWTAGGEDPQVTQFEPIQPKLTIPVVATGQTAHGALITSLTSHDVPNVLPVVNTPTVDTSATSPQVLADSAAWPSKLATITTSQAPYGRAQNLVLVPGQFIGSTYRGNGVQRLFDNVGVKVFYAPDASTDFSAPVISGADGSIGGSSVTFTASATDDGPVKELLVGYRDLDGSWRFAQMAANSFGQYAVTVTLSRAATASDLVPFFIQAVDAAGNVGVAAGKADGFVASADTTPPTITGTLDHVPNANGWVNANSATVTFVCTDTGSGVDPADCPAPQTVTAQGVTVVTGTTVDRAGNPASVRTTVRLDSNGPTVTPDVQPAGWSNAASATVTFTCADAVSGLDASGCPAPQTVTAEGSTPASGTATDLAGNATAASATVQLDRTAPTITAAVVPAANPAGWSKGTSATVTFTCTDTLSGVAACPAPATVSEGVTVVGGTAVDHAGNSASISVTVGLDGTKPTLTSQVAPAPNASGWSNAASATVTYTCADALSGVAAPGCPATQTVTAEGATTISQTVSDLAGNSASVTDTIRLDRTPPKVAVVLTATAPVTASCSTTDPALASAPAGTATSGVANPATLSAATARNADGIPITTATCSGGTDKAGNLAPPVSRTFVAPMTFVGFLDPVNNPPVVNTGNSGRTYPAKFQLKDAQGAFISSLKAVTSVAYATVACTAFSTVTDPLTDTTAATTSGLQYDPVANQYVYTWKTPSTAGCYILKVSLADLSTYLADFKLK